MKTLKSKMLYLGLNPKREFLVAAIISFVFICVGVAVYIFLKQLIYAASCLGMFLIFNLVYFSRYSRQINEENIKNLREFATIFGYFRIFIHNGYSVYSALKEILPFANKTLKKNLEDLISEIDNDKSVQPFVKFGKLFNEIIVEEMMISIYQMIDDGENSDYLNQFELIFDKFSDLLYSKYLQNKNSRFVFR